MEIKGLYFRINRGPEISRFLFTHDLVVSILNCNFFFTRRPFIDVYHWNSAFTFVTMYREEDFITKATSRQLVSRRRRGRGEKTKEVEDASRIV